MVTGCSLQLRSRWVACHDSIELGTWEHLKVGNSVLVGRWEPLCFWEGGNLCVDGKVGTSLIVGRWEHLEVGTAVLVGRWEPPEVLRTVANPGMIGS